MRQKHRVTFSHIVVERYQNFIWHFCLLAACTTDFSWFLHLQVNHQNGMLMRVRIVSNASKTPCYIFSYCGGTISKLYLTFLSARCLHYWFLLIFASPAESSEWDINEESDCVQCVKNTVLHLFILWWNDIRTLFDISVCSLPALLISLDFCICKWIFRMGC